MSSVYDWPAVVRACRGGQATFARHLERAPMPEDALVAASAAPGPGEPYGRTPLLRDAAGEVLVVRWRENAFCAPHDHGAATGFVRLLRGSFVERSWEWRRGELVVVGEARYEAPCTLTIAAGGIHDMKATGSGLGVHFYLPAITGMRVFDRARRETLVVHDDCGAWIPRDGALVLTRAPF
jgi:Cysteine dioxygenase type I